VIKKKCAALKRASGGKVYPISAAAGTGIEDVLRAMLQIIKAKRAENGTE
jgi:predicted GTPase